PSTPARADRAMASATRRVPAVHTAQPLAPTAIGGSAERRPHRRQRAATRGDSATRRAGTVVVSSSHMLRHSTAAVALCGAAVAGCAAERTPPVDVHGPIASDLADLLREANRAITGTRDALPP